MRKLAAFAESPRPEVQRLGDGLLLLSQVHLVEWHRVREGEETREHLQELIARLEPLFVGHLERGVNGACKNLLAHRDALFTYASVAGIPPTNNHVANCAAS